MKHKIAWLRVITSLGLFKYKLLIFKNMIYRNSDRFNSEHPCRDLKVSLSMKNNSGEVKKGFK